ncbi:MAG: radical SAM protein [bacterium]
MSILFGPVPSRRLGRSLGVDMVPYKTCSFNCVYCELGLTTCQTLQRTSFLDLDLAIHELKDRLSQLCGEVDYITLAGSGEPTLNSGLGELVSRIKGLTHTPVAVLTNSSLLSDPEVRKELLEVDLIVPSLDAVSQKVFERINLPVEGTRAQEILESLIALRREFSGQIWLEILFCQGINDHPSEVELLRQAVQSIRPDQVQLNTVVRPPAVKGILPCTPEKMQQLAAVLDQGAEVVGQRSIGSREVFLSRSLRKRIIEMLKRRPCTLEDIVQSVGLGRLELLKVLDELVQSRVLKVHSYGGNTYYQAPGK